MVKRITAEAFVTPLAAETTVDMVFSEIGEALAREANSALHMVVVCRMRTDERTRAYVARRTLEGLSKREIMRCLKRYVAREIYRVLTAPSSA